MLGIEGLKEVGTREEDGSASFVYRGYHISKEIVPGRYGRRASYSVKEIPAKNESSNLKELCKMLDWIEGLRGLRRK